VTRASGAATRRPAPRSPRPRPFPQIPFLTLLPLFIVALSLFPASSRGAARAAAGDAAVPTNDDCLGCHSDATLTMTRRGATVSLHVDPAVLKVSPHADLACVDCHAGFKADAMPHRPKIAPVDCMSCHSDAPSAHLFHAAMAKIKGGETAPGVSCKDCHGTHDVVARSSPDSPWSAPRLDASCGRCHAQVVARYQQSAHGRAAAAGVASAPRCLGCHVRPITHARAGGETVEHKRAEEKLCLSCHLDDPAVRSRMAPSAGFIAAYESSVHGAALQAGNARAATCADCHGSHEMAKGFEPQARVDKRHIPGTCGGCHAEVAAIYAGSVHGVAVAKGSVEAPVCTDCHGEHNIRKAQAPDSPVAAANVSAQVCSPCHSSVRLSAKYGIRADRFRSYSDSFHGLAIRGGSVAAANCASCHGSHDIRPSTDPRSSVNPANLAATCGHCHPGANIRFASGKIHVLMSQADDPVLYWIATIYTALIVLTIGGMLAHNLLDFVRKARHRLRVRRGAEPAESPAGNALYLRMTLGERLQHAALLLSFTVLVISGFMLRDPEAWWVQTLRHFDENLFNQRGWVHRVAGVVMVIASVVHLGYLTLTTRGRQFLRDIWLRVDDLRDATHAVGYNLGLRRARPRFGRFSYVEKSEYWALVWGTMVMAATGIILWFEDHAIALLTKLGWDVARTIHFYEAVLATLAIIVWHLYFVIFNPDVYPLNLAFLTGTLSESEMEEEHPLELEDIQRRRSEEEARALETTEPQDAAATRGDSPAPKETDERS